VSLKVRLRFLQSDSKHSIDAIQSYTQVRLTPQMHPPYGGCIPSPHSASESIGEQRTAERSEAKGEPSFRGSQNERELVKILKRYCYCRFADYFKKTKHRIIHSMYLTKSLWTALLLAVLSTVRADDCINKQTVTGMDLKEYRRGDDKVIKRACFGDENRHYYLIDENPVDGQPDALFPSGDFTLTHESAVADAVVMVDSALSAYQYKLGKKDRNSEYFCKKGISSFDAIQKEGCFLKEGETSYFKGKPFTGSEFLTSQLSNGANPKTAKANYLFKSSYVIKYDCNGEEPGSRRHIVSITYDATTVAKCEKIPF